MKTTSHSVGQDDSEDSVVHSAEIVDGEEKQSGGEGGDGGNGGVKLTAQDVVFRLSASGGHVYLCDADNDNSSSNNADGNTNVMADSAIGKDVNEDLVVSTMSSRDADDVDMDQEETVSLEPPTTVCASWNTCDENGREVVVEDIDVNSGINGVETALSSTQSKISTAATAAKSRAAKTSTTVAVAAVAAAVVPPRTSLRQSARLEAVAQAKSVSQSNSSAITASDVTVAAAARKKTIKRPAERKPKNPVLQDKDPPCSLLDLLQSQDSAACILAREIICHCTYHFRFPIMSIISLGFYFCAQSRRVDFEKKWKELPRVEKAMQSLHPWIVRMGARNEDASLIVNKLLTFFTLCWKESPKESRRKRAS